MSVKLTDVTISPAAITREAAAFCTLSRPDAPSTSFSVTRAGGEPSFLHAQQKDPAEAE